MKQKFLSILALAALTLLPQGAWATELTGEVLYSLTTVGDGTVTGGTFDTNGITKAAETSWALSGTTPYVTINLDQPLSEGDVIEINGKSSASSKYFYFFKSTTFGSANAGVSIAIGTAEGSKYAVVTTPATPANSLIGLSTIYVAYSSSGQTGTLNYIKIYKGKQDVLTATKTWYYKNIYDAPSAATGYPIVNDGMFYSKGILFEQQTEFSSIGKLLNIQSSGNDDATMSETTSKYLKFYVPAGAVQVTVNAIPYGDSNKTLYCKVGDQEAEGKEAKGKSSTTKLTFATKYTTDVTPVYLYAKGTGTKYYIQDITATITPAPTVTLDNYGYATFASVNALDLANMSADSGTPVAYKASISGTTVNFSTVSEAVQANTGVLLVGDANSIVTIPIAASGTDISATNAFHVNEGGSTFAAAANTTYYGMLKNEEELTFAKFNPESVAIPANKAYLTVVNGSARELTCVFGEDSETTGIDAMHNAQCIMHNEYYDLQGRKVAQPTKGLYIVNGKKVIIK